MSNSNTIVVEDSNPTFQKVLTIVSSGSGKITGVQGVKGAAEETYRDGYVNLTPANLGFQIVELSAESGTLDADTLALLVDNPHNYIGYGEDVKYIYSLTSVYGTTSIYSAIKNDLTGTMYFTLNTSTGDYSRTEVASATATALENHINDDTVHFSGEEKEESETKIAEIEETVNSLKSDGGEVTINE